jgi:hypothetical protein
MLGASTNEAGTPPPARPSRSSPGSGSRLYSCPQVRTKIQDPGVRVPGSPACAPGCCSAIGMDVSSPCPARTSPCVRWRSSGPSGVSGAVRPRRCRAVRVHFRRPRTGTHPALTGPGCPRSLPSYVATSSQARASARPARRPLRRAAVTTQESRRRPSGRSPCAQDSQPTRRCTCIS